jgi:FAD dependent oxidoreductase
VKTLTGTAVRGAVRRNDGIARGAWPIELHPAPGQSTYESIANRSCYNIPYDALRSATFENLWFGGRAISADDDAYGSVRVIRTPDMAAR